MSKFKVGLVGLIQLNFRGDKEKEYKRCVEGLQKLSEELDFEFYYKKDFIVTVQDAENALKELKEQNLDFLLILNVSFSSGYLIQTLSELDTKIGLWSLPEPTKAGPLPLNSFCAMNMNASIMSVQGVNKKFKWFYGHPENPLFLDRFKTTVKALKALKNLEGKKILLIGGWAPGFDNLVYDPVKIKKTLGVKVSTMEFGDLKERILKQENIEEFIEKINNYYSSIDQLSLKSLPKMAALIKTVYELREKDGYDAFAIACWPKFRTELSMVPCAAFGYLTEMGMITTCEGDVYSTLSMMLLKEIANYPPTVLDLSDFDTTDNTIFLWHCGIGNKSYGKQVRLEKHFNPGPKDPEKGWLEMAPVGSTVFEPAPVTVMRFTENLTKALVLNGEFVGDTKESFDGSRGWLGKLSLNGEKISVLDLISTIMFHKFEHHYTLVKGNYLNEVMEVIAWLGIKPLEKVEYKDYLQWRD